MLASRFYEDVSPTREICTEVDETFELCSKYVQVEFIVDIEVNGKFLIWFCFRNLDRGLHRLHFSDRSVQPGIRLSIWSLSEWQDRTVTYAHPL